ncbi:hypothetical protein D9611_008736 [Ephemerocybe angulata]|uniref:Ubiquitin-like protease family profile domain-containing protein n=1 Tax=Ephemerocybe angulata TaxID=980116 RepID=A0A8H5CBR3_9AGAR|nr:hypothetical protein D9611_008736 [Tulosesus angulatus]
MSVTRADRDAIAGVNGTTVWKRAPTEIQVPGNKAKMAPNATASGSNPFNNVGKQNVGLSRNSNTQKRNQLSLRKKDGMKGKQSQPATGYQSNPAKARTVMSTGPRSTVKRPDTEAQHAPSDGNHIDLSEERVWENPSSSSATRSSKHFPREAQRLTVHEDGPSMKRLEATYIDDDPIEEYDKSSPAPTKEMKPAIPPQRDIPEEGGVRDKVKRYEEMGAVDLRDHIRPRNPSRQPFGPGPLVPSSDWKSQGVKRKAPSSDTKAQGVKRMRRGQILPISKYCDGSRFVDQRGRATWEGHTLTVLDSQKKCTPLGSTNAHPFALLKFRQPKTGGKAHILPIALVFDCSDAEWDFDMYNTLRGWCKPHAGPGAEASRDVWKALLREYEEYESHTNVGAGDPDNMPRNSKQGDGSGKPTKQSVSGQPPASRGGLVPNKSKPQRPMLGNPSYPGKSSSKLPEQSRQASTSKAIPNTATSPTLVKKGSADPPRRSTRQSASATDGPHPGDDEVILVYPPGVPGKVNITNADIARLQPGEFLNDTLIEFGLKLWLKELEEKNPELAKQVHVFSSFFYKKLNKRNMEEGYNSVRKWTGKFDLFEKKYIIVPINEHMHWYLALIYEPEHVLAPPPPSPPKNDAQETIPKAVSVDGDEVETRPSTPSEEAVEADLTKEMTHMSVGDPPDENEVLEVDVMTVDSPEPEAPASPMCTTPEVLEIPPHSEGKPLTAGSTELSNDGEADEMNIIEGDDTPSLLEESVVVGGSEIPPGQFYGVNTRSGHSYAKAKVKPTPRPRKSGAQAAVEVYRPKHTYVLTLDSLGTQHKQACRQLAKYLKHEAKDKKGFDSEAEIILKAVNVPTQPNFCDCGLYLLHLAQTFISDPKHYMEKVFTTTAKTSNEVRQELWRDEKVPNMREDMKHRIQELSKEWKRLQTTKPPSKTTEPEAAKAEEVSSDEDIVVEMTVANPKAKGKKQAAARLR